VIGGRRGAREGREWVSMCSDVACHIAAGGPRPAGVRSAGGKGERGSSKGGDVQCVGVEFGHEVWRPCSCGWLRLDSGFGLHCCCLSCLLSWS